MRGEFNVILRQVFSGVKSLGRGCGQIGFAEKREEGDEELQRVMKQR